MPDLSPVSVDALRARLQLAGVTVLRLEVSMPSVFEDEPSEEQAGVEVPPIAVLPLGERVGVALSQGLQGGDDVVIKALLLAEFHQPDEPIDIDPDRDAEALREFGHEMAQSVLQPRLEAIAKAASGLVGQMTRVYDIARDDVIIAGNSVDLS